MVPTIHMVIGYYGCVSCLWTRRCALRESLTFKKPAVLARFVLKVPASILAGERARRASERGPRGTTAPRPPPPCTGPHFNLWTSASVNSGRNFMKILQLFRFICAMPRKRIAQVCCYKVSCPTSKAQYYSILAWHGMIGKSKAIVAHSRVNEWKQVCAHQGKKGTRSLARTYFKSRWTLFLCLWQFAEILLLLHMPYRRRAAARKPAPARVKLGVSQAGSYVRRALTGKRPLRFLGEKFHPPTHG